MKKLNPIHFTVITILLIGFNQNVFAQDKIAKEVKIYSNFAWQSSEQIVGFDTIINKPIQEDYFETRMGYFSPAFAWASKRGNRHEIELSSLQFNQVDDVIYIDYDDGINYQVIEGERNTNISISMRYELDYQIIKNKDKRLRPSIGFAAMSYFSKSSIQPKVSSIFSSGQLNTGTLLSIVPRLTFDLNKKCFIDLNVPYNLFDISIRSRTFNNPVIPVNQRTITTFVLETLPSQYLIRLGFGIRL